MKYNMSLPISPTLTNNLKKDYNEILDFLIKKGYGFKAIPDTRKAKNKTGEAYSIAYPIQGILKYHGFVGNPNERIAYFPSISLNNGCGYTVTYLKFDNNFKEDLAYLDGQQVLDNKLVRIKLGLDYIRDFSGINTKALLISRNFLGSDDLSDRGKGLGTSASGSSALAIAACSIIYNNDPNYINNYRLISIFSRFLSGSGTRSATGGFSLWLSHPTIKPLDCYAIRLDREKDSSFLEDISILTIPIKSDLKTNEAHEIATKSKFFPSWLKQRKNLIIEFIEAIDNHDLNKIGELAEYDTLCLHSVAMTAPHKQKIIAWAPETLKIMQKIKELQESGYNVYYSIDTGPSVVLLSRKNEKNNIIKEIKSINLNCNIFEGNIGGPCKILDPNSPEAKKLENDINKVL